jgi:inhibitor of cysteine peptidase
VAQVDEVEVAVVSTRPQRVRIDVRGTLPDRCTEVDVVRIQPLGARIEVTITTRRPFGARCEPEPTAFTRSIPMFLRGSFPLWFFDVNGKRTSVTIPPDLGPGGPQLPL